MIVPTNRKQRVVVFVIATLALIIGLVLLWGWQTGRISFRAATDKTTLEIANDQFAKVEAVTAEIDAYSAELLTTLPIYQAGDVKDKDRLAEQMLAVAKKRFRLQGQLLSLGSQLSLESSETESNPAIQALGHTAFPGELLTGMRTVPGLAQYLELPVDIEGELIIEVVEGKDFHRNEYAITLAGEEIKEVRFGVRPSAQSGDKVKLKAISIADVVVLGADSPEQLAQYLTITTPSDALVGLSESELTPPTDNVRVAPATTKRVAVIAFTFTNNRTQPVTTAKLKQLIFTAPRSAKVWFSEVSEGKIELVGDVYGYYNSTAATPSSCTTATRVAMTRPAERELARALGIGDREPLATLYDYFDHLMFVFPEFSGTNCGYAGAAPQPGTRSYFPVNSYVQSLTSWTRLPAHELGHSFGLGHARNFDCRDSQGRRIQYDERINPPCYDGEYDDQDDVMGGLAGGDSFVTSSSSRHYSGINLNRLGWLQNQQVQTVTSSGTYTLYPSNVTGSGVRLLKLPNTQGGPVYIEYRRPSGLFDNYTPTTQSVNGVLVRRLGAAAEKYQTRLLYGGGPHQPTASYEPAVGLNKTLTLFNSGVSIRTAGLADGSARVEVTYFNPTACVKNRWEQTVTPVQQTITAPNTNRQFLITLRNTNIGSCEASTVTPVANSVTIGASGITKSISPVPLTIAPGQSAATTLTVSAGSSARTGRFPFTIKTIDPLNPGVAVESQIDVWVSW